MKKAGAFLVMGLGFVLVAVAVPAFALHDPQPQTTGNIVVNGQVWRCTGPVALQSVQVTIGPSDPPMDAVLLDSGCTGSIGSITVVQYQGDGIKVGAGVHDLTVGAVNVRCYAHAQTHQDGVQVMGGKNIRFDGGYVGCYSANDSQLTIHTGAKGQEVPTNVIFDSITADPQGAGAYGVSNGESFKSGYTHLTLASLANRHDLFQGATARRPVWSFAYLPAGVRANFPIH